MTALLEIGGLTVRSPAGPILRGVTLQLAQNQIMGVVGESGSGKSTLGLAVMRLLPADLRVEGSIRFRGAPVSDALRGTALAMVAQDPMTALNPLFTIGTQMADVQRRPRREALARAADMLTRVGLSDARQRLGSYPHELSGGMRQRVAIAMALLVNPALLIADEPTTALDATVEAQIAALFAGLRQDRTGSVLFISHQLGLVAQLCDTVCVLYAGMVVETGPVDAVIGRPLHPYTQALLSCEVDPDSAGPLHAIPGAVPNPARPPPGCLFAPRCAFAEAACTQAVPPLTLKAPGQRAACIRVADLAG